MALSEASVKQYRVENVTSPCDLKRVEVRPYLFEFHLETGKRVAFSLVCVCFGIAGISWGGSYIHRYDWHLIFGVLALIAGFCVYLFGAGALFHEFIRGILRQP